MITLYTIIIFGSISLKYMLDTVATILNVKHISPKIPAEFDTIYDTEKYKKSQLYLKDKTKFSLMSETVSVALVLGLILTGGFNIIDQGVRT